MSVHEPPVYLFWPRSHSSSEQICRTLLSTREVAPLMLFPSLVVPDCIDFSSHVTIALGHLGNKVCSLFHGFPGWKSGCTTTTSPESFISLKSKCQPGQKSQGRPHGSLCKLSGCFLQPLGLRPSEAVHRSLPHGLCTTWQLASSSPVCCLSYLEILVLSSSDEARSNMYCTLIYVN